MAEYQGKKVTLNKIMRDSDGSKKFKVYTKNDKGNVVVVRFGDPNMEIKRDDPEARKNFRARHNCDNPGPKWKARYWSCKQWRKGTKVKGNEDEVEIIYMSYEDFLNIPEIIEDNEPCCDDCGKVKAKKPGLWENIRRKKERMGKDYRPAKPGNPDRPTDKALKESQSSLDQFTKREIFKGKPMKKKESAKKDTPSCWDGYERVPGKKPGEPGSCRKKSKSQFSEQAFMLVAQQQFNPFKGPQKPTDGNPEEKKKKKKEGS